jgi:hypothetical protein
VDAVLLGDVCVQVEPPLQEAAPGHTYKCHIPPDELLPMQQEEAGAPAPTA